MSREWRDSLVDIVDACLRIERYVIGLDRESFKSHAMIADAVLRNLEIIGEAVKNIPFNIRNESPSIEWTKVAGMRDWLVHAYFHVNLDIVWDVIEKKLVDLRVVAEVMIQQSSSLSGRTINPA